MGVKLDKQTGQFVGVEQMLDMVEKSGGSAAGRDSTRAAVNELSRSRQDTQLAF